MATDVPFEIKGETRNVEEEDIARKVLQCRHSFDTETLLLCRKVSGSWKYGIDSFSGLWNRMPLEKAIKEKCIPLQLEGTQVCQRITLQ